MHKLFKLDWILLLAILLLVAFGLIALWSISFQDTVFNSKNFTRQLMSVGIGLTLLFFFAFFDYRIIGSNATRLYFFGLALLIVVALFGTTVRGTTGWIGFGSINVQPVEFLKLIMVVFLAGFLSKKKSKFGIVVRVAASIVLVSIPAVLILMQPDFGSAAIIMGVWIIMLAVSDSNKKHLVALALIFFLISGVSWQFLKSYQRDRIVAFVSPERDPRGSGYNAIQAMVAVGSGGMFGKGLGHGSQSQLNFLPEKHTDFIFAVISEELGFFGALAVIILLGVILFRMKEIARGSRDNLGYLLTAGVMATIFLQAFINIGMNIGLVPVTGVPLPLVSYGGSSLVTILASVGIAENVYLRRSQKTVSGLD